MWPLNLLCSLKNRRERRLTPSPQRAGSSRRARVPLALEPLEERWLPNATMPSPASPAPSFVQAAITLSIDGFELGQGFVNQYVFHIDANDAYPNPPAVLNASIAFNSPYVGPFAPLIVLAGEISGAEVQYQLQLQSLQTF
ncbi:MAG TPA: hypothetical protein VMG10_22765 [Gemmataceae bacterium]|nr:hypothetical protein [Gemmataceae bacterium]